MGYYLKLIGTTEDPLPVDWTTQRPQVVNGARLSGRRMPPLRKGDRVIYYAVGRQRLCGLLEVVSEKPTRENPPTEPWTAYEKDRWPWWVGLKPIVLLPADERAPHADEVDFDVQRIVQKSHIPIGPGEFKKMEEAIRERGRAGHAV